MKARVSEKTEQAHIVQLLRSIGADVWVLGTRRAKGDYQGTRQTPGLPDVLACLPYLQCGPFKPAPVLKCRDRYGETHRLFDPTIRHWLAIECKSATGRLRTEQQHFQACCADSDMLHVVGGVDDVIAKLVQLGYLKAENVAHYRQPAAAVLE